MTKKILVIQTSLNQTGNTDKIAKFAFDELSKEENYKVESLDLKESNIELCNGNNLEDYSEETQNLFKYIQSFDAYILASPIYNYSISGVCKIFLDIYSKAMEKKYVGFIENAGSHNEPSKPITALKDNLSYFKIKLLEVCPRSTYKSFKGDELVDETFKSEFDKMRIELGNLIYPHKSPR
jgi:FMN reductase